MATTKARSLARVKIPPNGVPVGCGGWWKEGEDWTSVRIHLSFDTDRTLVIRAMDAADGEAMLVRKASFKDGHLEFETVVPSTRTCVGHRWTFLGPDAASLTLTFVEQWVRTEERPASPRAKRGGRKRTEKD